MLTQKLQEKTSLYLPRFIKRMLTSTAWAAGNITQSNLIQLQLEPNASNHYTATCAARLSYSHVSIIPFHSFKIQLTIKPKIGTWDSAYIIWQPQINRWKRWKTLFSTPKIDASFRKSSRFECFIQRVLLFKLRTHTEPTRYCYRPT